MTYIRLTKLNGAELRVMLPIGAIERQTVPLYNSDGQLIPGASATISVLIDPSGQANARRGREDDRGGYVMTRTFADGERVHTFRDGGQVVGRVTFIAGERRGDVVRPDRYAAELFSDITAPPVGAPLPTIDDSGDDIEPAIYVRRTFDTDTEAITFARHWCEQFKGLRMWSIDADDLHCDRMSHDDTGYWRDREMTDRQRC